MNDFDLLRSLVISLVCLLSAMLIFGTVTAWRERSMPALRRAPFWSVLLFAIGYLMLLAVVGIEIWFNIGNPPSALAYAALAVLAVNLLGLYSMVRFHAAKPTTTEVRDTMRWLMALNRKRYRALHDEDPPATTRFQDSLPDLPEPILQQVIEEVQRDEGNGHTTTGA